MYTVMILEPDPMVSRLLEDYVRNFPGFRTVCVCRTCREVADYEDVPDLMLGEPSLEDGTVREYIRSCFERAEYPGLIVVTADNGYHNYMQYQNLGAVDYILKPFTQDRVRTALQRFDFWKRKILPDRPLEQCNLDRFYLRWDRERREGQKENRMSGNMRTRERIEAYIQTLSGDPFTVETLTSALNLSQGTARRYLEQMAQDGRLSVESVYGKIGRPTNYYREIPRGTREFF